MLHLIGTLGADGCGYKSVEFCGSALPQMSISERMTAWPTSRDGDGLEVRVHPSR